jgi:hypothetical protein
VVPWALSVAAMANERAIRRRYIRSSSWGISGWCRRYASSK